MKKAYHIFNNIYTVKPRKSAAVVLVLLVALLLFPISVAASEFPEGSTFNGMQITYTISGVAIDNKTDVEDYTTSRTLTGIVTGKTVTVTATVKQENGYSATISAVCGDQSYSKEIQVGESDTFTLSVPVTKDMKSVSVSISMTGYYNAGTRGLVVNGNFIKLEDAGCSFSDLCGQVEVLNPIGYDANGEPEYDDEAWHFAKLDEPLYVGTKIKTGLDSYDQKSAAIISFADMSTFVTQENTTIELVSPTHKESIIKLACGNIWVNIKKMVKDGTMDVEMSQAVAGIKGTIFVCEVKEDGTSTLKVIEGEVRFTDKATGNVTLVKSGEMIAAGPQAVPLSDFDIKAEHENWLKYDPDLVISNESNISTIIFTAVIAFTVIICFAIVIYFLKRKRRLPSNPPLPRRMTAAQAWNNIPREPVTQAAKPAGPASKKFCTGCGTPVKPDSKFCSGCGTKL